MTVTTDQYNISQTTAPDQYTGTTLGIVVDTNDPQNAGRLRIVCPRYGDNIQSQLEDIPWAIYGMGFVGTSDVGTRGPGYDTSEGTIAYGLWAIPKVGAKVVVDCIDGDPRFRVYKGCVPNTFAMHTLPHGRWFADDSSEFPDDIAPHGPYTSREQPIQPLYDNFIAAFGDKSSPERATRAADYSATRVDPSQLGMTISQVPDDYEVVTDNWTTTQGYQVSRSDPNATTTYTEKNFDNQVTSLTSPGFHSISMDDRQENCRIRIRTTSGHQIIMDDTNERMYISTPRGENWIELDQNGNIDIYSSTKLSIHAQEAINFTSKEINLFGSDSVNIRSDNIVRTSATNVDTFASEQIQQKTDGTFKQESVGTFDTLSGAGMNLTSGEALNILSEDELNLTASSTTNIRSGGNIIMTAPQIHENGPAAKQAARATPATPSIAFYVSRVPQHEPWARQSTKNRESMDNQYTDPNDPNIGKVDGDTRYDRNPYWRR